MFNSWEFVFYFNINAHELNTNYTKMVLLNHDLVAIDDIDAGL